MVNAGECRGELALSGVQWAARIWGFLASVMGSYWGVQCQEEPLFELKQKPELAGSCRSDVLSWGGGVRLCGEGSFGS